MDEVGCEQTVSHRNHEETPDVKLASSTARRMAAASLAAVAVVGATGCSAVNYQATTHQYSASDGVLQDIEDVKFRHLAFVGAAEGEAARAIGSVNNGGTEDAQVQIQADGETFSFTVPAGESVSLEHDEEFVLDAISAPPGGMHEITLSVDGTSEQVQASVLDGTLEEYREALPGEFDEASIEHLEHGPDTWGSGAAHHEDDGGH